MSRIHDCTCSGLVAAIIFGNGCQLRCYALQRSATLQCGAGVRLLW